MPRKNPTLKKQCVHCKKEIAVTNYAKHLRRHLQNSEQGLLSCQHCHFSPRSEAEMNKHVANRHSIAHQEVAAAAALSPSLSPSTSSAAAAEVVISPIARKTFECLLGDCVQSFDSYYALRQHKIDCHMSESVRTNLRATEAQEDAGTAQQQLQQQQFGMGETQSQQDLDFSYWGEDEELEAELRSASHLIKTFVRKQKHQTIFNFMCKKLDKFELSFNMADVFRRLQSTSKISISFGLVLRHIDAGCYRYFYTEKNTVLGGPVVVRDRRDMVKLLETLSSKNLNEILADERPDTKWKFFTVTNMTVYATHLDEVPLGCIKVSIPAYILHHNRINCLLSNRQTKEQYSDNLCMFRAVAMHKLTSSSSVDFAGGIETMVQQFLSRYLNETGVESRYFKGVPDKNIDTLEKICEVDILMYTVTQYT